MDRRRVATPTLFRAAAALLLASSCAVAPFLPAAEAASQPIKQLTYCDGQGAAVRLGFEGYECPEHAIDPSFNSQSDPADSCEAIQVRGAAEARARGSLPSPTAPRPPPRLARLLQILLQKRDRRARLTFIPSSLPSRLPSQRLYPPAPDAPYWFYNTARKCLDDPWTRVEDATLIPHSSVPNPAGVRYQLSWGGGEYRYVDTDSGNMYKTPNATYESLTDGRGAWGDDEPMWGSGDTGDAAWLQADFGEIVTVNEVSLFLFSYGAIRMTTCFFTDLGSERPRRGLGKLRQLLRDRVLRERVRRLHRGIVHSNRQPRERLGA
jgi:hypothetical protein